MGRFLSADPEIQDPTHTQSYNRYTYVWNNPTNDTDPTGFATASVSGTETEVSSGCAASTNCTVADYTGALFGKLWGGDSDSNTAEANHTDNKATTSQIAALGHFAGNFDLPQPSVGADGAEGVVNVVGKKVGQFEGIANQESWKTFEQAAIQRLRNAGYRALSQVRITWPGANGAYAVLDAVGVKGKNIAVLEAKDGFFSKLSPAQKAVIREAIASGEISLTVDRQATQLELQAGEALAKQGVLYVSVEAEVGSRASGSFARIAGREIAKKAAQRGAVSLGFLLELGAVGMEIGNGFLLWSHSEEIAPDPLDVPRVRNNGFTDCSCVKDIGK